MDVDYTIAADYPARHWFGPPGDVRIGSDAHRDMACRMFCDTFDRYRASAIVWPRLDEVARARLAALPVWRDALRTEGLARMRMLAYAASHPDPMWRNALELNGWEEGRHSEVLLDLVAAYGIDLEPEPGFAWPKNPERAYMLTGFGECIDSFFAFGLFEFAKRSGYLPRALVDIVEPMIQEEARHVVLFANWIAWHRANMPRWRRPWFELKVVAIWIRLICERIGIARGARPTSAPADAVVPAGGRRTGADVGIGIRDLLDLCIAESDRRMAGYDERLRRPATMPALARFALRKLRDRRRRKPSVSAARVTARG